MNFSLLFSYHTNDFDRILISASFIVTRGYQDIEVTFDFIPLFFGCARYIYTVCLKEV